MMTNPAYSCNSCHGVGSLSAANLQARTQAYSERLLATVMTAMQASVAPVGAPYGAALNTIIATLNDGAVSQTAKEDALMTYIQGRTNYFPTPAIAKAATTWKVFTYEDGAPHGQTHGHGGSWAHNSLFARQMMFDAIESLGGVTTGLSRP